MKKQLFIIVTGLLIVGQTAAMKSTINAQELLAKLYTPIGAIAITDITYTWIKNFDSIVNAITEDAITKSKDVLGEQSLTLITAATTIRDITHAIITLYVKIKQNVNQLKKDASLRSSYETTVSILQNKLSSAHKSIDKTYHTISKKQAQKLLQDTITFLNSPVLTDIEQELQLLDPSHFA